jgi:hypothetical protein
MSVREPTAEITDRLVALKWIDELRPFKVDEENKKLLEN